MSGFLDDIGSFLGDVGSTLGEGLDWLFTDNVGKTILNLGGTALAAYALSEADNLTKKKEVDKGVRLQVDANPYNKIPVIYGKAALSGAITDVYMADDHLTMWFCITICEKTGKLDLGRGAQSEISFLNVYWNDSLVIFNEDGYTLGSLQDVDTKNKDTNYAGLIEIYAFSGDSKSPVPATAAKITKHTKYAYNLMPQWTAAHNMSNCVFALVKVKYDKSKNLTSLGALKFHLQNSMTEPGDCLFDYMTNTIYGAQIPAELIEL